MDPFHARLARLTLAAAARYGFCLAGGYAVQAHGGRFSGPELLRMAAEHDPGFNPEMFTEALRAVRRFAASAFEPYHLSPEQVDELQARLLKWADEIEAGRDG